MFDLIIIGAGPAGMSASIYASKANLNTLLIEADSPGGLLNKLNKIDNYLGFKNISGSDLAFNMYDHIRSLNVSLKHEKVLKIEDNNETKKVITNKGEYFTKKVLIAIGRKPKKAGVKGEKLYNKKGISYCAICDSHLYKDKDVVVTGNNDLAFSEAIYLSDIASSVTLITNNKYNDKRIKIINSSVKEFIGQDALTGVKLENDDVIKCSAAFIYNGYITEVNFLNELGIINDFGNIDVDSRMETNVKGIYAAGDIIKKDVYQINTAVSEGCIAALSAKMDIINEK